MARAPERSGLGPRVDLPHRPELRHRDRSPDPRDPAPVAPPRDQTDQEHAAHAGAPAEAEGASEEIQEQPSEAAGRADEAVQGGRGEPARRLPPDAPHPALPVRDVRGHTASDVDPFPGSSPQEPLRRREQPPSAGQRSLPERADPSEHGLLVLEPAMQPRGGRHPGAYQVQGPSRWAGQATARTGQRDAANAGPDPGEGWRRPSVHRPNAGCSGLRPQAVPGYDPVRPPARRHGRVHVLPDMADATCQPEGLAVVSAAGHHPRYAADVRLLRAAVPCRARPLLDRLERPPGRAADVSAPRRAHRPRGAGASHGRAEREGGQPDAEARGDELDDRASTSDTEPKGSAVETKGPRGWLGAPREEAN